MNQRKWSLRDALLQGMKSTQLAIITFALVAQLNLELNLSACKSNSHLASEEMVIT
jgi:hypothetical protein